LRRHLDESTLALVEQIYVDQRVRYSKVRKALAGIESAIHLKKSLDKERTAKILSDFRDFTNDIDEHSKRSIVINHFFVGAILNAVSAQGCFTPHNFTKWAREQFARGRSDQTLLNSRYIADLREVAIEYADQGVRSLMELHYLFETILNQRMAALGEEEKRKPTEQDRHQLVDDFKQRLEIFHSIVSNYRNKNDDFTMRTAMDATITHYHLVDVAKIPETVATKDHSIMIALYKGFSLERSDAFNLSKELKKMARTDQEMLQHFDDWIANRMLFAPNNFLDIERDIHPERLYDILARFSSIPYRGSKYLKREVAELKKETQLVQMVLYDIHRILVYLGHKLNLNFDNDNIAYRDILEQLRTIDRERNFQ
jgi:hypothetical protein